jgi:hypothetical protein
MKGLGSSHQAYRGSQRRGHRASVSTAERPAQGGVYLAPPQPTGKMFIDLVQWLTPPSTGDAYPALNHVGINRLAFRVSDRDATPLAIRQDLLRIAQEAISNALRHAKPTAISVTLRLDPPSLALEIDDNGCGINTSAETREGFGLVNMRARVKKLNGSLEIRSAPGRGTSILV